MVSLCKLVALALFIEPVGAVEVSSRVSSEMSSGVSSGVRQKLKFDAADAKKNRPVRKIITLLKTMKDAIEEETEKDEENYDKMTCWCDLTEKRLKKQIKDAATQVQDTISEIEVLTGLIAELTVRIRHHEEDLVKWDKQLDEAHDLRRRQMAEFHEEEKDLMESVGALRAAVIVLEKHHTNLLQMPKEHVNTIAVAMERGIEKHEPLLKDVLTASDRDVVASLIQTGGKRRRIRGVEPSYSTGSGQIFGIIEAMKESFEANLKSSQKEEFETNRAYEDMKEAKEKQIEESKKALKKAKEDLWNAKMRMEECKALIPKTKENAKKDDNFLTAMRERCEIIEREWPVRQKTRSDELEAVTKTIEMLSSEDAHELFSRTFNPSLIQMKSTTKERLKASRLLAKVAAKTHNPSIAMIAVNIRLDTFKRVKAAIDKMIVALKEQKSKETVVLEDCKRLLKKNEETTAKMKFANKEAEDKINEIAEEIKAHKEILAAVKVDIKELLDMLAKAKKERMEENAEYKQIRLDQEATQELLKKALEVLKEFYKQDLLPAIPALVQQPVTDVRDNTRAMPDDFGFNVYEKQTEVKADGGVIGMIEVIIYDSKATVKNAERDERNAVKAFKELQKDTNEAISVKQQMIIENKKQIGDKEVILEDAKQDLDDAKLSLVQLDNEDKHIHKECDYLFNNYDLRQKAIDEEVVSLKKAKDILSGADYKITAD